jgi:NAD(P)-dependent dehydrogenase (short-subunit alcohol dehydrogenase family)
MGESSGVAVVVGAGGEIGAACAVALAPGHAAVLCVDRDAASAAVTVDALTRDGHTATALVVDAGGADFAATVVGRARELGQVRTAVHAIAHEEHVAAVAITAQSLDRSWTIGPLAAFALFRELHTGSALASGAALTVIGSLHAQHPFAGALGYNLAHAALAQLVRTLAQEWTPLGVRTNAVVPGWIRTRGEAAFYDEDHLGRVAGQLPMGRFGTAEDVAGAVAFLSSPAAAYVSGSFLTVDGGLGASLAVLPGGPAS